MHYYIVKYLKKQHPPVITNYFKSVEQKCRRNNVHFRPSLNPYIKIRMSDTSNDVQIGGYFCSQNKELGVAVCTEKRSDLMGVLLHEESHMDQWLDKKSIWYDKERSKKASIFWDWLDGNRNYTKNIDECNLSMIKLEIDCEKRTVLKCKKHFPKLINLKRYKKQANAYFYFLRYLMVLRKWPILSPLDIKELVKVCPDRFQASYAKIPTKIQKVLSKYYGNEQIR